MTVLLDWNATGWRYTFATPAAGWNLPGFDDSGWSTGQAGFGDNGNAAITAAGCATTWAAPNDEVWLRHSIGGVDGPVRVYARIDDRVDAWLDGDPVGRYELAALFTVDATPASYLVEGIGPGWVIGAVAIGGTSSNPVLAAYAVNTNPGTPRFVDFRVETA